jgi:inorganic pyrophosphatase
VKILGCWAMIDEGETDWKILAINTADENAAKYNEFSDVPEEVRSRVFTFLRDYKIPSGSGPNQFAFNSELQPKVHNHHCFWFFVFFSPMISVFTPRNWRLR